MHLSHMTCINSLLISPPHGGRFDEGAEDNEDSQLVQVVTVPLSEKTASAPTIFLRRMVPDPICEFGSLQFRRKNGVKALICSIT